MKPTKRTTSAEHFSATKNAGAEKKRALSTFAHINAIDGLRALAIVGVVLYHMRPSLLPGGFLGVTVFFVITGFLSTRSVMRSLEHGNFSYARYLVKRIVRLLPAVLVVIALTAAGTYLVSPSLLPKVQADALSSALFFGNWSYIFREVPYFAAAGLPSPLTHLWYLGVIMQFYVIWPLVLMAAGRVFHGRKHMAVPIVALIAASCALMALLFDPLGDTARVYYGTDTRAAELLMGALVALAFPGTQRNGRYEKLKSTLATIIGTICVGALGAGFVLANGESPFMYRGGYLVCAIICAVLLACAQRQDSALGSALSLGPLHYLGSRSFSIYLVHYPLLILMNPATRTTVPAWWEQAFQILVVLLVAEVFYQLIEAPSARLGRRREAPHARRTAPVAASVVLVIAGACATGLLVAAPFDWQAIAKERAETLRPELVSAPEEPEEDAEKDQDAEQSDSAPSADDPSNAPAESGQEADTNAESAAESEEEPEPEPEPEKPAPIAEKIPDNLPYTSWNFDPATGTCDARALIIGDSVTEGATPALREMLPNALVDGKISRQLYVGQDVYAADVAGGFDPEVVVFALGLNGLIRDDSQVQALIDVAGGKPTYFVTIRAPLPLQDSNNSVLRRLAAENPNVGIIDWHGASEGHSEYLEDDGIHLTPSGMTAFATLVRQALCGQ